ncbi:MAG: hypothetical protein FWD45_01635, partial [Coriobacteriia bacterium]|nr:hypothetical protein [Coriobacteriia bacterium]
PLVNPEHTGMIIAPISEHSLKAWSIVSSCDDVVVIEPSEDNTQQLVVYVDGEPIGAKQEATEIVRVTVNPSKTVLELIQFDQIGFYDLLTSAFFGDADAR